LKVNQLPTGWSQDNSSSNSTNSCYYNPLWKVQHVGQAQIKFDPSGGTPELIEQLGSYKSGKTAFAHIAAVLNACTSFTEDIDGQAIRANLGAMSSPTFGNQSAAYTATFNVQGTSIAQDFDIVRNGNIITAVGLADYGSVDVSQLDHFVSEAVSKL